MSNLTKVLFAVFSVAIFAVALTLTDLLSIVWQAFEAVVMLAGLTVQIGILFVIGFSIAVVILSIIRDPLSALKIAVVLFIAIVIAIAAVRLIVVLNIGERIGGVLEDVPLFLKILLVPVFYMIFLFAVGSIMPLAIKVASLFKIYIDEE